MFKWLTKKINPVQKIDLSIFSKIVGYDDFKVLYVKALNSPYPVNNFLLGGPGTGKSEFLRCIKAELKDKAIYVDAAQTSTKAGLRDLIFEKGKKTKVILIEEINLLNQTDLGIFLGLAEDQRVTDIRKNVNREIRLPNLKIFATANFLPAQKKIKDAIISRFSIYEFQAYELEEMKKIALHKYRTQVKDKEVLNYMIERVYYDMKTTSLREIRHIVNLDIQTIEEVDQYFKAKLKNG
ncbi:MAG: AAA family ATPase [Nitrososphaeraceae archaeon]|nr:AAA family ATPase [Nitrososphaeraceae archaeon]